jgi:hypothetical protein
MGNHTGSRIVAAREGKRSLGRRHHSVPGRLRSASRMSPSLAASPDADRRSEDPMSESVPTGTRQYNRDGLITLHNHGFLESAAFKGAYQEECRHRLELALAGAHWFGAAAAMTSKLAGDFVECSVNRGLLRSAIMQFLDCLGKQFCVLDKSRGIDAVRIERGLASGVLEKNKVAIDSGFYVVRFQSVRTNVLE